MWHRRGISREAEGTGRGSHWESVEPLSVRDFTSFLALQQWSEVDSASSSLAASKVRAVQREVLVVAGCALPLDHRTFQPHTLDLARWSTDRVHFSPPLSLALCRARGSIFAVGAHEMRGIHSTIGKQVWFFVVTLLLSNSPPLSLHVPPLRSGSTFVTARSGQRRLHFRLRTSGFSTSSSTWSSWALFE